MIGRVAVNLFRSKIPNVVMKRDVHKGFDSTPPMRFIAVPQRIGLYFTLAIAFLSYPTYVICNLDNLRPRVENNLGEGALAEKERRLALAKH
uniref:Uncharacterized protein n=1 Tax=Panagrolaimus sp. JU765 TaxID=591449 RepID=A0AC34RL88_9BILA